MLCLTLTSRIRTSVDSDGIHQLILTAWPYRHMHRWGHLLPLLLEVSTGSQKEDRSACNSTTKVSVHGNNHGIVRISEFHSSIRLWWDVIPLLMSQYISVTAIHVYSGILRVCVWIVLFFWKQEACCWRWKDTHQSKRWAIVASLHWIDRHHNVHVPSMHWMKLWWLLHHYNGAL